MSQFYNTVGQSDPWQVNIKIHIMNKKKKLYWHALDVVTAYVFVMKTWIFSYLKIRWYDTTLVTYSVCDQNNRSAWKKPHYILYLLIKDE